MENKNLAIILGIAGILFFFAVIFGVFDALGKLISIVFVVIFLVLVIILIYMAPKLYKNFNQRMREEEYKHKIKNDPSFTSNILKEQIVDLKAKLATNPDDKEVIESLRNKKIIFEEAGLSANVLQNSDYKFENYTIEKDTSTERYKMKFDEELKAIINQKEVNEYHIVIENLKFQIEQDKLEKEHVFYGSDKYEYYDPTPDIAKARGDTAKNLAKKLGYEALKAEIENDILKQKGQPPEIKLKEILDFLNEEGYSRLKSKYIVDLFYAILNLDFSVQNKVRHEREMFENEEKMSKEDLKQKKADTMGFKNMVNKNMDKSNPLNDE